jgi:hypothetical protein
MGEYFSIRTAPNYMLGNRFNLLILHKKEYSTTMNKTRVAKYQTLKEKE